MGYNFGAVYQFPTMAWACPMEQHHLNPSVRQPSRSIGGIVLAGGLSKRMGRSKPALIFHGETLLQRVVRITSDSVSPVVVAVAPDQESPEQPGCAEIVHDPMLNGGPLAGILAGLLALQSRCDAAFVVPCDQPLITSRFIQAVVTSLDRHSAAIIQRDSRLYPLTGIYRTSVAPALRDFLAAGQRAAHQFARSINAQFLRLLDTIPPHDLDQALSNVNTPSDYAKLMASAEPNT